MLRQYGKCGFLRQKLLFIFFNWTNFTWSQCYPDIFWFTSPASSVLQVPSFHQIKLISVHDVAVIRKCFCGYAHIPGDVMYRSVYFRLKQEAEESRNSQERVWMLPTKRASLLNSGLIQTAVTLPPRYWVMQGTGSDVTAQHCLTAQTSHSLIILILFGSFPLPASIFWARPWRHSTRSASEYF